MRNNRHLMKSAVLLTALLLSGLFSASAAKYAVYFDCEYNLYEQTCILNSATVREVSDDLTMAHGPEYDTGNITTLDLSAPIIYRNIPCEVKLIKKDALNIESLKELTLPAHLSNIENGFLFNCTNLEKVSIGAGANGVYYTSLSGQVLYTMGETEDNLIWVGAALKSYEFPANVKMAAGAFYNASNITNITANKANSHDYTFVDGILYSDGGTVLNAVFPSIKVFKLSSELQYTRAYAFCKKAQNNITYAELGNHTYLSLTESDYTLRNEWSSSIIDYLPNLKKVTFTGNNVRIEDEAFMDHLNIEEIDVICNRIEYLGDYAFARCPKLVNLHLPPIYKVGERAFYQSQGLRNVVIDTDVANTKAIKPLGYYMFEQCLGLEKITITGDVTEIPPYFALNDTKLKEVILPESCVVIWKKSFYFCPSLTTLIAPNLQTIGECALTHTGLSLYNLPSTVSSLEEDAFESDYVHDTYTVPENIVYMGRWAITAQINTLVIDHDMPLWGDAFNFNCPILVLGKNVKRFNGSVFNNSNYPKKVVILADNLIKIDYLDKYSSPGESKQLNFSIPWRNGTTLYVPDHLVETYEADQYWTQLYIRPLSESGVEDVTADGNGLDFEVADGVVTVNGNEGQSVEIYSLDGKRVAAGVTGQPLNVGKGLHIIRCGSAAKKVMVK